MFRLSRKAIVVIVILVLSVNSLLLAHRYSVFDRDQEDVTESPQPSGAELDNAAHTSTHKIHHTSAAAHAATPHTMHTPVASHGETTHGETTPAKPATNFDAGMKAIIKTLDELADITPGVESLKTYSRSITSDLDLINRNEIPLTKAILSEYLQVSQEEIDILKKSHAKVMEALPSEVVANAFKGRGIVMTGGGKYFPMVLTAIAWLRESGNEMPIEVYMSDPSEYESEICDNLFPELDVECRVIESVFGEEVSRKLMSKYALKPLSILASKFDDIYFMDADSYPLIDINTIFDWDVYKDTGMVLSSDYWPRFVSPAFYEIAGIQLGDRVAGPKECPYILEEDREHAVRGKSTESGQLFVKKSAHIKSLLLATYYNLYGSVYYELLMQAGPGMGDKDTFTSAAAVCGETFYQNAVGPATLGYTKPDGKFEGNAMVQASPITDREIHVEHKDVKKESWALHANYVKGNVRYMMVDRDDMRNGLPPLRQMRYLGPLSHVQNEINRKDDVEQRLYDAMRLSTCEWALKKGHVPLNWQGQNVQTYCDALTAHVAWLGEHDDRQYSPDAVLYSDLARKGKLPHAS